MATVVVVLLLNVTYVATLMAKERVEAVPSVAQFAQAIYAAKESIIITANL